MVRDVTDADFDTAVIERSREIPVIVDFWAAWCAPCRQLTPTIERVAADYAGDVEVYKMDVDANPKTAAVLGIRSIPTVIAFRNGVPADAFLGAHPENAVREFFKAMAPSEADRLVEKANGDEDLLREALAKDPDNEKAILALAGLLAGRDEREEARKLLARIPHGDEARRLLAEIDLAESAGADIDALRKRVAGAPDDANAHLELGRALAARRGHDEALEHLLQAVRGDVEVREAAREAMLDVFAVLSEDDPLVAKYRRELANALY